MLLNLTPNPVVLIAESGEKTEIPASGYVARVETTRREVGSHPVSYWGKPYNPTVAMTVKDSVPIYEETPGEIVVDAHLPGMSLNGIMWEATPIETASLLIVSREVAEMAAQDRWCGMPEICTKTVHTACSGPHPLASRMVWACDPVYASMANYPESADYKFGELMGYRALQRVPQ